MTYLLNCRCEGEVVEAVILCWYCAWYLWHRPLSLAVQSMVGITGEFGHRADQPYYDRNLRFRIRKMAERHLWWTRCRGNGWPRLSAVRLFCWTKVHPLASLKLCIGAPLEWNLRRQLCVLPELVSRQGLRRLICLLMEMCLTIRTRHTCIVSR